MPITINGTGTIDGISVGGLPNGTVTPADLSTGAPVWDASGNVGIGTASPASKLNIVGTNASNGCHVRLQNTSGSTWQIASVDSGQLFISRPGVLDAAVIDSSGNLLVGTTSKIDDGKVSINFSIGSNRGIVTQVDSTGGSNALWFRNPNGVVGAVTTSGSSTSFATSSDYRLKNNIQPMQNALEKVAALKPCTYKWIADGSDGEGFIAHELQAVCPDAVTGEKDAVDAEGRPIYQGIDTSFLVATLTAAIQELNAKVDAQAAEIAALKGQA